MTVWVLEDQPISIHALLAESDVSSSAGDWRYFKFQSTLSLRRATIVPMQVTYATKFQSTLSLRRATGAPTVSDRGYDLFQSTLSLRRATKSQGSRRYFAGNFNPRSPCGERPKGSAELAETERFQSTLSLRRATATHPNRGAGD